MSLGDRPLRQQYHLRGRVRVLDAGRFIALQHRTNCGIAWVERKWVGPSLGWEVVNTKTGQVIASDDTRCSVARAVESCAEMVEIARRSVFWGYERKALR